MAKHTRSAGDIDLRLLVLLLISKWRPALALTASLLTVSALGYTFLIPYQIKTQVVINDAQTSQLQAFTNNFFGMSKTSATQVRKNQTPSAKSVEVLQRPESWNAFARFLVKRASDPALETELKDKYEDLEKWLGVELKKDSGNIKKIAGISQSVLSVSATSPTEIQIASSSSSRTTTHFLGLEYSQFAVELMKSLEEKEIEHVRTALEKQRDHFKSQFLKINKELIAFQTRPDNVLSLASGGNIGNYLSDLMVRKNEVELKVTDNLRTIEFLGGKKAATLAASRGLGQRSQVQQLIEATKLLQKQAVSIQESIDRFTKATSGSAEVLRMADELKKTSDREFKNFQESTDMLSKLGVYQISIDNKFELLRSPELDEVRKATSLGLLLAIAFFLSQILICAMLYRLWMLHHRQLVDTAVANKVVETDPLNIVSMMRPQDLPEKESQQIQFPIN